MRLGLIIVLLAGIAVAVVHIRRAEDASRHEIQRLRIRQVSLRRKLWDQQARMGRLAAPAELRRRADRMALHLDEPGAERVIHLARDER